MTETCNQCTLNTIDLVICKVCDYEICSDCWETTHEHGLCLTTIQVDLSDHEISLLRNCLSDLGIDNRYCVRLQLKIANAILDGSPATQGG